MYRCRKCSAEFEEPLNNACPACGYPIKGQHVYSTTPRQDNVSYGAPPSASSPSPQRGRSGRANPLAVGLIAIVLLVVVGVAILFLFNGFGDVHDSSSEEVYIPEREEPIWSDRGTEMEEAGYAPVDNMEPDLWPIADNTLWFGYPQGQQIWYNVMREDASYAIELGAGLTAIGDIYPLADGSGVLTVLQYEGDGSGVYFVDLNGNRNKLVSEDDVWNLLIDDGIPPHELDRAARINNLFVSPRISPNGGIIYVGAGSRTERRIVIANLETGETSQLTTYRDNSVPRVVTDNSVIMEYYFGDTSTLIYKHSLITHEEENIICPGIADGFVMDERGMIAYRAIDYDGNPAISYLPPDESTRRFYLPEGESGEVSIGPGGVIVTSGRENGKTSFFFFNPDNVDLRYSRNYNLTTEFVSGVLGPSIKTEQPKPSGKDR